MSTFRSVIVSAVIATIFAAVPAFAQALAPSATATSVAPIYLQPGAQTPLRVARAGTVFKVLQEEGEWVEVEFNDPQFGRRVGWVEKKLLRISRPELEPMDLSVTPASAPTTETPRRDPSPTRDDAAQSLAPIRRARGWLDVNLGAAGSAQKSVSTEVNVPDGEGEFERYRVGYNSPTGASFDIGAGIMITRVVGIGVQLTGTAHRDAADLDIRIPHPLYFDAHATDSSVTDRDLDRVEGGVNLSLVGAIPTSNPNVSLRFYGGPTYFRLEADAVNNIRYFQQFGIFTTANSVEIVEWESNKVEETAWGFHAGVDAGFFFSRYVGVGGFARFSRGTVTFTTDDFTLDEDLDVKVGGFQAGGGLRIRF